MPDASSIIQNRDLNVDAIYRYDTLRRTSAYLVAKSAYKVSPFYGHKIVITRLDDRATIDLVEFRDHIEMSFLESYCDIEEMSDAEFNEQCAGYFEGYDHEMAERDERAIEYGLWG